MSERLTILGILATLSHIPQALHFHLSLQVWHCSCDGNATIRMINNFLKIYSRFVPVVDLLYITKQHSSFALQLLWRLWFCKLWEEPLEKKCFEMKPRNLTSIYFIY